MSDEQPELAPFVCSKLNEATPGNWSIGQRAGRTTCWVQRSGPAEVVVEAKRNGDGGLELRIRAEIDCATGTEAASVRRRSGATSCSSRPDSAAQTAVELVEVFEPAMRELLVDHAERSFEAADEVAAHESARRLSRSEWLDRVLTSSLPGSAKASMADVYNHLPSDLEVGAGRWTALALLEAIDVDELPRREAAALAEDAIAMLRPFASKVSALLEKGGSDERVVVAKVGERA